MPNPKAAPEAGPLATGPLAPAPWYDASSRRCICTPSSFAREHLYYPQEVGRLRRLGGHHERQRSALDSFLLVAVCNGQGSLSYEGIRYALHPGQCFWIDCRKPHAYWSSSTDPWELRWVHFSGREVPPQYGLFRQQSGPVFAPEDFAGLTALMERLLDEVELRDLQREMRFSALLGQIVADAFAPRQEQSSDGIRRLREYLEENFTHELSLESLAEQFYMSKFSIARQFRRAYDTTVLEYIISLRITRAKQLLRYTNHNVAEIAGLCGYKSANYFTRQFAKTEGIPPAEYRRQWK